MAGAGRAWGTILRGSGRAASRRCGTATTGVRCFGRGFWRGWATGAFAGAVPLAGFSFSFMLLCQDGLHHVAGLGDVRQDRSWA